MCVSGDTELVRLLLKHSDPNIANKKGETPVMLAANKGFMDVVQLINDFIHHKRL